MIKYLIRRLLIAIPVIVIVSVLVFSMLHMMPGDPVMVMMRGTNATPEQIETIRKELGLDDPIHVQYGKYMWRALHGDFGRSLRNNRPVLEEISKQLPNTMQLAGAALSFAIIIGLTLGTLAAMRRNTWIDSLCMLGAQVGVSLPEFVTGLGLIFLFSLTLGWFPATGSGGVERLVLPALALGVAFAAITARLVRSSLTEVFAQDYILVARAKGLAGRLVVIRHAMKNALIPVVTIIGLQFGNLLGGAVVVETVFSRPGLGRLAVDGILSKDFPLVQGTVLLSAVIYVAINLIIDLLYAAIDPRIRYE